MNHESKRTVTESYHRVALSSIIFRKYKPGDTSSLKQRLGNQGFHDLMSRCPQTHSPAIRAKLAVSQPGDAHEREADRVADDVMRMREDVVIPAVSSSVVNPGAQRKCDECDEETKKKSVTVQRKQQTGDATPVTRDVNATVGALGGGGHALPASTRAFFEPRFGADFSDVRLHTDTRAQEAAASIDARAFTIGQDIAFAKGEYSPNSTDGQRLLAHELTHVVQQDRTELAVQRDKRGGPSKVEESAPPLGEYKSTDRVVELKPIFKPDGDGWELTVEGDFTTPESIRRLIWPTRDQMPVGVSIKPTFILKGEAWIEGQKSKEPAFYATLATFEITGLRFFTRPKMDPHFEKLFADMGWVEESASIQAARAAFRARHLSLTVPVLDNIDAALQRVTLNNPGLLEAFYRFYSSDFKFTDEIDSSSGNAGNTDQGIKNPSGYTDINAGVLRLWRLAKLATDDPLSLLGSTLIHEFAHTSHATDYHKGPGEGKAYGIENFFNERLGDKQRDAATLDLGPKKGDDKAFNTAYWVMKQLYEVIDNRPTKVPSLMGVSAQRAREMSVEFISKNKQGFSPDLKNLILKELGQAAFNSLPSNERQ